MQSKYLLYCTYLDHENTFQEFLSFHELPHDSDDHIIDLFLSDHISEIMENFSHFSSAEVQVLQVRHISTLVPSYDSIKAKSA